jgi:undecaprenyl-phosphate galactose phosphotransferase
MTLQEQRLDLFARPSIPVRVNRGKRAFDIAFSTAVLILFSPLLGAIALAIWMTSPGPILFRGKRLGQGGRPFDCLKFRTMYVDAEAQLKPLLASDESLRAEWTSFQKLKTDPRITPIGKFLRKTSLDELPQFWNVLKGDLSVVGPRPPTLVGPPENYWKEISLVYGDAAWKILSIKPGITGVWQVSGRSAIPLEERTRIELDYVEKQSFWKDLVLIIKTVPAVLLSKGAF